MPRKKAKVEKEPKVIRKLSKAAAAALVVTDEADAAAAVAAAAAAAAAAASSNATETPSSSPPPPPPPSNNEGDGRKSKQNGCNAASSSSLVEGASAVRSTLAGNEFEKAAKSASELVAPGGALSAANAKRLAAVYTDSLAWTGRLVAEIDSALLLYESTEDGVHYDPLRQLVEKDEVAAKVASHGLWILARVTRVDDAASSSETPAGTIEVEDVDDDQLRRFVLQREDIVSLPREPWELAHVRGQFTVGSEVFAMYPETTSFYRATVAESARLVTDGGTHEVCHVRFIDDEDDNGLIPSRPIPLRFISFVPNTV